MLKQFRQHFVQSLWGEYAANSADLHPIKTTLAKKNIAHLPLDHFAIIDLPGPHSGITHLSKIFTALGFLPRGRDYLEEKQNEFLWMCEDDCMQLAAKEALPQVVVADFRLDDMPKEIQNIILKYSSQTKLFPINELEKLTSTVSIDEVDTKKLFTLLTNYFSGRDWPLPEKNEFLLVQEFNELLAWVLIFGRKPNHFTLAIHLMDGFNSLIEFHQHVIDEAKLILNHQGGFVKGAKSVGILQSSTVGINQSVELADGEISIPTGFVEFVWRFPVNAETKPFFWKDYFTDFIGSHANKVIESLYGY